MASELLLDSTLLPSSILRHLDPSYLVSPHECQHTTLLILFGAAGDCKIAMPGEPFHPNVSSDGKAPRADAYSSVVPLRQTQALPWKAAR